MPLFFIDPSEAQSTMGQDCNNKTSRGPLNMTTGTGDFEGTSESTKPTLNLLPQNNEPERLVPNPEAFELAKNQSNSENPPDRLIGSLENKNVIEPPFKSPLKPSPK